MLLYLGHMQPVLACAASEAVLLSWLAPPDDYATKSSFSMVVCTLHPCITAELCDDLVSSDLSHSSFEAIMAIAVQSVCLYILVLVSQPSHDSTHHVQEDSSDLAASSAVCNF